MPGDTRRIVVGGEMTDSDIRDDRRMSSRRPRTSDRITRDRTRPRSAVIRAPDSDAMPPIIRAPIRAIRRPTAAGKTCGGSCAVGTNSGLCQVTIGRGVALSRLVRTGNLDDARTRVNVMLGIGW